MPGVYISYPFCAQKCTYCNFASGVFPRELEPRYVDGLVAEIIQHQWLWQPETVYLGGGTPSGMAPEDLERILRSLPDGRGSEPRASSTPGDDRKSCTHAGRRRLEVVHGINIDLEFPRSSCTGEHRLEEHRTGGASASGRQWKEATIEVAPGAITLERATAWIRAGINRVSLGVQSFVQRELARTGRKHTALIVESEIALLRSAGLTNINVDLIAGLPGQTRASWSESLSWIERLDPPHVSVYMLEIDQDSRLGTEVLLNGKRYGAPDVPSDELTAEFYETGVERLGQVGIQRYEISNFARPGYESLHNLKYWQLEPYDGFGADAHSFDGVVRGQNIESPSDYVARIESGQSARIDATPANAAEERFFVGLRLTHGIQPRDEEWLKFEQPIQRFIAEGLLARDGSRLRLTDRGVLFSNEVFAEFITS
jgi:oxygen-independent coproporphyrinogen III oxidase